MFQSARLALVAIIAFALVLVSSLAQPVRAQPSRAPGAIIEVYPGDKPIRKALRNANPGDILNLHTGTYPEKVVISKDNITLRAAGDGPVILDPNCNAVAALTLNAEGITVKGLTVRGGTFFAIDLQHQASGTIKNNTVISTCEGAEYGVNVFDGGSIKVIGNRGEGWNDAVVYIGGINATPTGALVVKKNNTRNSTRGIIIEDSTNVNIKVLKNTVHDNTLLGILIHNSDGVLIDGNTVTNNASYGIHLDTPSDDNSVKNNTFSGHTFDIYNQGDGNCFTNNTFTTSSGPTTPACP